jgi:large subunit ribosomal protein L9
VRDSYGRNFLLPHGKAIAATPGAEKQVVTIKRSQLGREIRGTEHALEVKQALENLDGKLKIVTRTTGDGTRLIGSITAIDVADAIKTAGGPVLDRRTIDIKGHIKTVGSHPIAVKLHPGVTARVTVEVVALTNTKRSLRAALSSVDDGAPGPVEPMDDVVVVSDGPGDPLARLRQLAALAELLELDQRRTISAAAAAGHNQQTIAKEANLSQPTVSRLIARFHRHPELLDETPRELLLRREAGEISTREMLSRLSKWPWTFGHVDETAPEGAESWVPGSWDDLIGWNQGLLRDGEYDDLRERVKARMTASKIGV